MKIKPVLKKKVEPVVAPKREEKVSSYKSKLEDLLQKKNALIDEIKAVRRAELEESILPFKEGDTVTTTIDATVFEGILELEVTELSANLYIKPYKKDGTLSQTHRLLRVHLFKENAKLVKGADK